MKSKFCIMKTKIPYLKIHSTSSTMPAPDMVDGQLSGSRCAIEGVSIKGLFALLVLSLLLPSGATTSSKSVTCHKTCLCASNIVSCSKMNLTGIPMAFPRYTAVLDLSFNQISKLKAEWTPVKLSMLHSLLLSHNGLTFLSSEAFLYVTRLRYLDLSSNGLKILEEFIFEPLEHLEVLLLYNNYISQIDRTAFSSLNSLQKLYLSQNQIQRFPLELVKERNRLEKLTLLDVSTNRLKLLPIQELQVLPAWIKNGLYFHNNPLPCSCELYSMLARWHRQELSSATDFRDDHTCLLPGAQKEKALTLELNKVHLNCSAVTILDEEAYLEQFIRLGCDTRQRYMLKSWVLPGNVQLSSGNQSSRVLSDGSLQVGPITLEDSGIYTCYAVGESFNETLYVTVLVHNATQAGGQEGMKTAYTTLVGCLASAMMVLIYLYLTPCRCICCPGQGLDKRAPGDSLHSSILSVSPTHEDTGPEGGEGGGGAFDKPPFNRHVTYLDPKGLLEQNGRLSPCGEEDEEWQEEDRGRQEQRRKSDAESLSSVCSDTPIVV
ncbi:amphoterin-induced protein 1-like [Salvelinus sp. IW2-2015]|uniref:amphoterin-induced protein 1-like n=1 Tax=Salvelinus sp. IW2-2015 TaxID=2691554 RepID=UPI000CDF9340|nr:amphoterin-induced protein 1-like [Salvelinus alpinus]